MVKLCFDNRERESGSNETPGHLLIEHACWQRWDNALSVIIRTASSEFSIVQKETGVLPPHSALNPVSILES